MSAVTDCFSSSYQQSREKFLHAATELGADIDSIAHPATGPDGESLFMDFASIGPADASVGMVIVAGTHGIEGFCGAGVQMHFLRTAALLESFKDVRLVLIHGHNPHGFAWLRRTNEDNVDLNRNYVDFSEPQEMNEEYQQVSALICPVELNDASDRALQAWTDENGLSEYQRIVMGGQRIDANGLFYGDTKLSWSHSTMQSMLPKLLAAQQLVGMMDIHTGLGPNGHGDLIHAYPKNSPEYDSLREWFGEEMIGINAGEYGDTVAAVPRGPIVSSLDLLLPNHDSRAFVVEYGTQDFDRVLESLRSDNWLHVHGDLNSAKGQEIKQEMRACFFDESEAWQQKIIDRAVWSMNTLRDGLLSV